MQDLGMGSPKMLLTKDFVSLPPREEIYIILELVAKQ